MTVADNAIAIKVEGLSKTFKLPHEKSQSIKGAVIKLGRGRGYDKFSALKNVNFEVKKGEFFGIVGKNGSGKSTLLKILAGVYAPDEGAVQVNGSLTPFIELGVGFNPELTGRDNVYLNGALLGFNRDEVSSMYDDIVGFAELEKFMEQKLKNYSSGMQVRLAFSIAIRARSDILLLDEVLAVGDAAFQQKCFEYFGKLKKSNTTVVLVSHDAEALMRYCDRGVLIDSGKLVAKGSIKEVVDTYRQELMSEEYTIKADESKTNEEKPSLTKIVTIKSCKTMTEEGPADRFHYGKDITVEIAIESKKILKKINIGIGIYDNPDSRNGNRVFGTNTKMEKIELKPSSRTISMTIKSPQLRKNVYYIHVVVFEESEFISYDYVENAASFYVQGAPELKSTGVIIAKHEWKSRDTA